MDSSKSTDSEACNKRRAGAEDDELIYSGTVEWKRRRIASHVEISQSDLVYPKSLYKGWAPPIQCEPEQQAITDLLYHWHLQEKKGEHVMFRLEQFSIYRSHHDKYGFEFAPLHHLQTEPGVCSLFFDGILAVGQERRYVQRVAFDCLTVEGYGDLDVASLDGRLCIQSHYGSAKKVWYELGQPSAEYSRYHEPFLWIAHFCKYFVEFLVYHESVSLHTFSKEFLKETARRYQADSAFQRWHSSYGCSCDFRRAVVAYVGFLWKETWSVGPKLCKLHPVWEEVDPQRLGAIKFHQPEEIKTVVTPFVHECFNKMVFASELEVRHLTDIRVSSRRAKRRVEMGLTHPDVSRTEAPDMTGIQGASQTNDNRITINHRDVVFVRRPATGPNWASSISEIWYAYVQDTRETKAGRQLLDVIWLYEPSDTTLGHGKYPIRNELFFSDNCACGKDALDAADVLGKIKVRWFATNPTPKSVGEYVVRKKFRTKQSLGAYDFVSLERRDFKCGCKTKHSYMDNVMNEYVLGDTILVRQKSHSSPGDEVLVPAQILEFLPDQGKVLLRRFARCVDDMGMDAAPNQVLPTEETYTVTASRLIRSCQVRRFSSSEQVAATPYNRGGKGDLFFVLAETGNDNGPSGVPPFREGTDFSIPTALGGSKLSGMGLFCGGGNFDRGLEDGGAVKFRYAVDWASPALHSYRANLPHPDETKLYLGSVNDYLAQAIGGADHDYIAKVGDVDLIAGGSPCPGWSRLQRWKDSQQSLRNCSLVASVMSFVDLYMPEYLFLENVPDMAITPPGNKDQNAFSQVLCCLVAMGYQVQQFLMDAYSYGSIQSRSRVFIVATAPNSQLLERPPQTYSHPWGDFFRGKNLGWASNGLPFGSRRDEVTPFKFLSAKEGLQDLPNIKDAHVHTCIPFPDHRTSKGATSVRRQMFKQIPTRPYGMNFVRTVRDGRASKRQIEAHHWGNKHQSNANSRSWSRMNPTRLVGCITTKLQPADAFNGRFIHYDQPRLMTVMEARRAQGYLDNEVVVGTPAQQWHIIGNSVDRSVSFTLGLQLRKSWLTNRKKPKETLSFVAPSEITTAVHVEGRKETTVPVMEPKGVETIVVRSKLITRPKPFTRTLTAVVEVHINASRKTTSATTSSRRASSQRTGRTRPVPEALYISDDDDSDDGESSAPQSITSGSPELPVVSSRTSPSVNELGEDSTTTAEQLLRLFQSGRNTRSSRDPAEPILTPADWSKVPERKHASRTVAPRVSLPRPSCRSTPSLESTLQNTGRSGGNVPRILSHDIDEDVGRRSGLSNMSGSPHTAAAQADSLGLRPRKVPEHRRSARVSGDSSSLVGPRDWSKLVEHFVEPDA